MSEGRITLSAREVEILAIAWQCFDSEPKVNYKKFADLCGYTEGSAKVTLGTIKRKLKNAVNATSTNSTPSTTPKKTANATPRSKKRTSDGDGESPSKKKKGGKAKSGLDEDDDEFGSYKVKQEEANDVLQGAQEWLMTQPVTGGTFTAKGVDTEAWGGYGHGQTLGGDMNGAYYRNDREDTV